jgi:hypothetical protein
MSITELVAAIDAIDCDDPEAAHSSLDGYLLIAAPDEVKQAAGRLFERARWWGFA